MAPAILQMTVPEDDRRMEYVDVCDENGLPTGEIVERSTAHRTGVRHRTAHVWIYRESEGRYQVLVQKRSDNKASFPGMYDTSCAGHVPAGEEPIDAAVRELSEELGIRLRPDQLEELGQFDSRDDLIFRGAPFRDDERCFVYAYGGPVDTGRLHLQADEVAAVQWQDLDILSRRAPVMRDVYCVPLEGLRLLQNHLAPPGRVSD